MPYLTNLAAIARRTGYPVIEVPGWKTRGHGPMSTVRTITCHHTAGPRTGDYPSLATVRDGRRSPNPAADLPGPLSQYGIGRSGTIWVIAAGLSYHAGASLSSAYTNPHAIGIEAEATGLGADTDWPEIQLDAYARLCAALVDALDLTVADVRGHKETAAPRGRKPDPSFDMAAFRHRVAAVNLKTAPGQREDPDMQLSDTYELTAADAAAYGRKADGTPYKKGDKVSLHYLLRHPPRAMMLARQVNGLQADVDRLTKQVTELLALVRKP